MTDQHADRRGSAWLALEALMAGLAYGAGLCWASVCLLASFRPDDLSAPYWQGVPALRSDTCGIVAFFAVAVFFSASECLRLRRRWNRTGTSGRISSAGIAEALALAASETVAVLASGLVAYLSVNAVTHPVTLDWQATHLASEPTEGTLRVIALLLCVCSMTTLRYLMARRAAGLGGRAAMASRPAGGKVPDAQYGTQGRDH